MSRSAKNVVIAVSLVAAAGLLLYRRVLPMLVDFAHYSDGARQWASVARSDVRHVVWDAPRSLNEVLGGELDTPGTESDVARSSDGRWIAFAAGDEGSRELFVAEVAGERVLDPRPLTLLNSPADEIAPAFAGERVYFASNCDGGAGGFDLYVADWRDGEAGEPQAVDGVNTYADELDPAARAGELVFASNRDRSGRHDFDLFAMHDGDPTSVAEIAALASPHDEREPSFAAERDVLYFASDREGSRGAFDLYRAFEERGAWLAPEALAELNTEASERAPAPSRDGMELVFSRAPENDGEPELWLARSREIHRVSDGPRGWYDLALAAALIALALTTLLAKRWQQLDVLSKCIAASIVIHLLFMAWSHFIHPEGGGSLGTPERRSDTFRVRLEPSDEERSSLRERAGTLEAMRSEGEGSGQPERAQLEFAGGEGAAAEPGPSPSLAAQASELGPGPAMAPGTVERSSAIADAAPTDVAQPQESFERVSGAGSELALEAHASQAPERGVGASAERAAFSQGSGPASVAVPGAGAMVAERAGAPASDEATRFVPADVAPSGGAGGGEGSGGGEHGSVAIAGPQEGAVARAADAASGPVVEARQFAAVRGDGLGAGSGSGGSSGPDAPQRGVAGGTGTGSAPASEIGPRSGGALALERSARDAAPSSAFTPSGVGPSGSGAGGSGGGGNGRGGGGPAIAGPREEFARVGGGGGDGSGTGGGGPSSSIGLPAPVATTTRRSDGPSSGPVGGFEPSSAGGGGGSGTGSGGGSGSGSDVPARAAPLVATARERDLGPTPAPSTAPRSLEQTPYRNRFGPEKQVALQEHGGTAETERAVAQGLRYLASRQHDDGAWGDSGDRSDKYRDVRVGNTALALLAFLGAGHTPQSGTEHSPVAARAIQFLLAEQDESTGHFGDSEAYSHGTSTYALAECFAITRDENLRVPLERAIAQIRRHQLARGDARRVGGWSYYYPDGATFDSWPRTSITSWQVMALESARLGGLSVPDASFDAALGFLLNAWDEPRGAFRYNHDPQRLQSGYPTLPGSTPAALFALALLGEDLTSPQWQRAVEYVTSRAPRAYRFVGDDEFVSQAAGNLYFWYYGSLALLRHGGDAWERWNAALKDTLLPAQRRDGSWEPIDIYCRYAGDEDGDAVYATAMCTLTLEVYYRYFTPLLRVK